MTKKGFEQIMRAAGAGRPAPGAQGDGRRGKRITVVPAFQKTALGILSRWRNGAWSRGARKGARRFGRWRMKF